MIFKYGNDSASLHCLIISPLVDLVVVVMVVNDVLVVDVIVVDRVVGVFITSNISVPENISV